ncbi:MAG: zincin-like metallopeptidase domain-containing protein [Brevinema sp.]
MKKPLNQLAIEIAEQIELGNLPVWVQPWQGLKNNYPRNFKTQIIYKGENLMRLYMRGQYPEFLTFNQIKELGGTLKKGSQGNLIYYVIFDKEEDQKTSTFKGKKHYHVFSLEDTEGIDYEGNREYTESELHTRNQQIEKIINNIFTNLIKIPLIHEGTRAFYHPSKKTITMPAIARFNTIDDYYCVLFHELAHAKNDRKLANRRSLDYAREELIAELSSFLICKELGIGNSQTIDDNRLSYIKSWASLLKDKPQELKNAIKTAEDIKNFLLNKTQINKKSA